MRKIILFPDLFPRIIFCCSRFAGCTSFKQQTRLRSAAVKLGNPFSRADNSAQKYNVKFGMSFC